MSKPLAGNAALVTSLRNGITWLLEESPQPYGALIQHHGIYSTGKDGAMQLCPEGYAARTVVIFTLHDIDASFTRGACDELLRCARAALPRCVRISSTWNGIGSRSFSIGLSEFASKSVRGLVRTYSAGCQEHRPHSVFCGCGWFARGNALAALPIGWR